VAEPALVQRVITALILAPLAVWGILSLPNLWFAVGVGAICGLAAWEWARIGGLTSGAARAAYVVGVGAVMLLLYPYMFNARAPFAIAVIALVWWVAALLAVVRYPSGSGFWQRRRGVILGAGLLVLVPTWSSLVALHGVLSPAFVLVLALLVWGADTGAYFAGRAYGHYKLAPAVSPGKTWEGLWGALTVTGAIAIAAGPWLGAQGLALWLFTGLCLATTLISVLGDLVESMFKRLSGVKDSGSLLPGHGGILDRIDSLSAAAPLFLVGLFLLVGSV